MKNLFLEVRLTKHKGRGLFSTKKINKGDIIEVAPTIVIPKKFTSGNKLSDYVFYHPIHKDQNLLALGFGSLFNHSSRPNVDWWIDVLQEPPAIYFEAKRKIDKGEELSIDYGYHPKDCSE